MTAHLIFLSVARPFSHHPPCCPRVEFLIPTCDQITLPSQELQRTLQKCFPHFICRWIMWNVKIQIFFWSYLIRYCWCWFCCSEDGLWEAQWTGQGTSTMWQRPSIIWPAPIPSLISCHVPASLHTAVLPIGHRHWHVIEPLRSSCSGNYIPSAIFFTKSFAWYSSNLLLKFIKLKLQLVPLACGSFKTWRGAL